MRKLSKPRAQLLGNPFVSGFTEVEKGNADLTIGSCEEFEDIFENNYPQYLNILCEIDYEKTFPHTTISAGYKVSADSPQKIMTYQIYDGVCLPLENIVSKVIIKFVGFMENYLNLAWQNELLRDPILFEKSFVQQTQSRRIDNFLDQNMSQNGVFHTKSKLHYFGGMYFPGIKLSDIQPCLFFVGTGLEAQEYIQLISAKDAIQTQAKFSQEIEKEKLTSLEDDISQGKVELNFQNQIYKSITSTKQTLLSNVFQILFRKES